MLTHGLLEQREDIDLTLREYWLCYPSQPLAYLLNAQTSVVLFSLSNSTHHFSCSKADILTSYTYSQSSCVLSLYMCHWLEVTKPTPTIIVNYIALKLHSYLCIVSGVEDKKTKLTLTDQSLLFHRPLSSPAGYTMRFSLLPRMIEDALTLGCRVRFCPPHIQDVEAW